jgi:glycosyltransferase involved in cell wall biosynthesis
MYSFAEQGTALRAIVKAADITWFPHYAHPWRCSGRWMCTVHDVLHLAHAEYFPGRLRRGAARALLADVRDRAAAVCFVTRFTQGEFHRLVGKPIGSEYIVGNGVDSSWFGVEKPPAGWSGRPYIVAVGNIKQHKGMDHLLQAMQSAALQDLDLVIIGRREGLRTVDHRVDNLISHLGSRCRWTGGISDQDLRCWVSHARMLVFPSLYEGFGIPPLEAMAAGVPVVASSIPSVREVCGDAVVSVFPGSSESLADGIRRLHQDEILRQSMIIAGAACAQRWTWDAAAKTTWIAMQAASRVL